MPCWSPLRSRGDGEELRGYITRQVIEKALFHKLGAVPVSDYMTTEVATVAPEADLTEIQDKIINNKQRILPVTEGNRIAGVITRTDLLNTLVGQQRSESGSTEEPLWHAFSPRRRNVFKFMQERLSERLDRRFAKRRGKSPAFWGSGPSWSAVSYATCFCFAATKIWTW